MTEHTQMWYCKSVRGWQTSTGNGTGLYSMYWPLAVAIWDWLQHSMFLRLSVSHASTC